MASSASPSPRVRVTVLLATYNGRDWLPEQLDSILDQQAVDVDVVALDDLSTDGTAEYLAERAAADPRITVLPSTDASGSAAANFYRLIQRAPIAGDLVALSDQDDVWVPTKLTRHAALITQHGFDAVSSNVTSFYPDGRRDLVRKDFPQRDFDFLLESPGPGSTFLMTPRLVDAVRTLIADDPAGIAATDYHDWLIYAVARSRGWTWHIDAVSTVDYRQHEANVMGANLGTRSALSRVKLMAQHWHRGQAIALGRLVLPGAGATQADGIRRLLALFENDGLRSRFAIARAATGLRRRPRDRGIIAVLALLGLW